MLAFQNPGQALWNQRHRLKQSICRLQSFFYTLSHLQLMVMLPEDYAKLFAIVLEFEPDIIIEVGRLYGNTTCILTEAANHLKDTSVLSLCLTDKWFKETLPRIKDLVTPAWLKRLDARVMDFLELDVRRVFLGKQRIFLLIDAHGWDVAEYLLGKVLPELLGKEHLILIHDIILPKYYSEVRRRYFEGDASKAKEISSYNGKGICRFSDSSEESDFVFAHGLAGHYPEFLALVDFAERNEIRLRSVEEDVRREIESDAKRCMEIKGLLGEQMYSPSSAFAWLTLNGLERASGFQFPKVGKSEGIMQQFIAELRSDLTRCNFRGKRSILTNILIAAKILLKRYPCI